jgi:hypothetical protein
LEILLTQCSNWSQKKKKKKINFNHYLYYILAINTMAEQPSELNSEHTQISDARGRTYLSPAKQAQLAQARENKKRKREEELERQHQIQNEVQGIRQRLDTMVDRIATAPQPQITHPVESDDEDSTLEFPAPRKRRRLLNPHRPEPVTNDVEPAGYGIWTKIGSLMGIIAFNSVVGIAIAKARSIGAAKSKPPNSPSDDIAFV